MAVSTTSICNMALAYLGQEPINSIDDGDKKAKMCKLFFQQVIDDTLRKFPFSCAVERKQLAQSINSPVYGFDYAYPLPSNPKCIRLLEVKSSENDKPVYRVESGKILTDETDCYIKYIKQLKDVSEFDSSLITVIEYGLAAKLAIVLLDNINLKQMAVQEYQAALSNAGLNDCLSDYNDSDDNADWVSAGTE